jgi:MraZ protein
MFIGEFSHTIDAKKRVSLPSKFRGKLSDGCVVTRGLDKCLWIYPATEWEKIAEKVARLPITQKNARSFARFILSGANEAIIDKVGRINIPQSLKDYAGIEEKVIVTGAFDHIEIWSDEIWKQFKKEMEEKSEEVAETLSQLNE